MGCVGVSADIGFGAPALDAVSICGFKFPPKFNFKFGFSLPALPPFPPQIPFPWIVLNCDLSKPISLGWGGGRVPVYNADAWDECAPD